MVRRRWDEIADNLGRFVRGEPLINIVIRWRMRAIMHTYPLAVRRPAMKALFLGTLAASQAAADYRLHHRRPRAPNCSMTATGRALAAALADADIVLTGAWRRGFPPAPRLRLLQVPLAGTDGIDVAALPKGVTFATPMATRPALGEFVIMMMLAWRHRLFDIATSFRAGSWFWSPMVGGPVRGEIGGQTVGIVGLGHIGREVAWRAAALGCRVVAANRNPREKPPSVERIFPWAELDRMLGECDVVVLSCALTPETPGLIDERRLARDEARRVSDQSRARADRRRGRALSRACATVRSAARRSTPGGATRAPRSPSRGRRATRSTNCRT